jgi:hypothetical protein
VQANIRLKARRSRQDISRSLSSSEDHLGPGSQIFQQQLRAWLERDRADIDKRGKRDE